MMLLFLLFALLSTFFGGVICQNDPSTICPSQEYISPCTCSKECYNCEAKIVCSNILNLEELNDVFRRSQDYTFYNFQIVNSSFMYIPSDAIVRKKMRRLSLKNNAMSRLFDKPPPESNLLFEMELADLTLQSGVKWDVFSSLIHLKVLILTSFEIKRIDQSFIDNFPQKLTGLFLSNTKTKDISDNAFAKLVDLERIFVQKTKIKRLKRSMFPAESKLAAMNFIENQISSLPDDIFSNMPKLKGIGFANTKITTLKKSVFAGIIPQLLILNLEGNDIECGCDMKWITELTAKPYFSRVVCKRPTEVAGLSIKDLKPSHFRHCE